MAAPPILSVKGCMPDWSTLNCAVDLMAKTLRPTITPSALDMVARDMEQHPREYGAWPGPNWDAQTLREELARRVWRLPDHPDRIPKAYRGLPYNLLRELQRCQWQAEWLWYGQVSESEAREWLTQCSINRLAGEQDWKVWLDNPIRWRFRHLPEEAFQRITSWTEETV